MRKASINKKQGSTCKSLLCKGEMNIYFYKRKFGFIILAFLLLSCNKQHVHELAFEKEYSVTGEDILQNSFNIAKLFVAGNYLIGLQDKAEYFIIVYDSETLKELGEFARKGRGPDEFPTTIIIDRIFQCDNNVYIWVHDLNESVLCMINITESLKKQVTIIDKKFKTKAESGFFMAFFIDSTKIIGRSTNSIPQMYRLQLYNPQQDVITKTVPLFPVVKKLSDDIDFIYRKYNYLYTSNIGLKNDMTKIASAMSSFNRIDIFDTDGILETSILEGVEIPKDDIQSYLTAESGDNRALMIHYNAIYTTDNYIYALYYGQPKSDYAMKFIKTEIRIFDWAGKPLSKIEVPDYLLNFSIDEEKGLMYGVDYFNGKNIRYDIKKSIDDL
jgi:hypothetical protein